MLIEPPTTGPRFRIALALLLACALSLLPACGGGDSRTISVPTGQPGGGGGIDPDTGVRPIDTGTPGDGNEVVADFGVQSIAAGVTARMTVTVPANAISLTLEALGASGSSFGLGELIGPGGRIYENFELTGAYIWVPGAEVFSTTVPNTDRAAVQLVSGGGDYVFRIRRMSGFSETVAVRALIETRTPVETDIATLDLNIWLADGITVTAATAEADGRLQAIVGRMNDIMLGEGVRIGEIDYYDVTNPAFDQVTSDAEFAQMLRTTNAASEERLNLFFVDVAFGGGVVGVAATVAGPRRNGTTLSGVMSVFGGFGTNTIGLIAAHEICHFLGLFHTVEQDGQHDFIDDTPNCPAQATSAACPSLGGGLLMHWQAVGGTRLTPGQGLVVRGHPLLGPRATTSTKIRTPPPFTAEEWLETENLGDCWCGSCAGKPPGPKFSAPK